MNAFDKIEHSLNFALSEFPNIKEKVAVKEDIDKFVIFSGNHTMELSINDIILEEGDGHYYFQIKSFLSTLNAPEKQDDS